MLHLALIAALLQAAPAPVDCTDADHSAFDFWIGDWDVRPTGSDTVIAHSIISEAAGGCAIREDYRQTIGPGGAPSDYQGASFSVFDTTSGTWRQFYIDSAGAVTVFEGGPISDGAMVLVAPGKAPGELRSMTLTPQPDGSVRQVGALSVDNGTSWSPGTYDFTYRRR